MNGLMISWTVAEFLEVLALGFYSYINNRKGFLSLSLTHLMKKATRTKWLR